MRQFLAFMEMRRSAGPNMFRHFKRGNLYDLIGDAIHTETEQSLKVYRGANGQLYARPSEMWDEVPACGDGSRRFTPVSDLDGDTE